MHQQITWHNASPEDGELARQREAIIRPLAAQPSLTPMVVSETAGTLKLRRSLVYHLVAPYRKLPQTSTWLLGRRDARGDRGSSIPVALVLAAFRVAAANTLTFGELLESARGGHLPGPTGSMDHALPTAWQTRLAAFCPIPEITRW